jgi:flavin reductase (DIM6/NTAB) family NADH-FMN oxidoreductase RutF
MLKHISKEEIENMEQRYRVMFINSLSGFKSANLIGTISKSGTNLAIISSVVHLGASPPLIGLVFRPNSAPRHTYENILEQGQFTINHVNESIYEKSHQTSARYTRENSEFDCCNLTEEYYEQFKAPFVKESLLKIGAKYLRSIKVEENNTIFVIAKIESVFIDEVAIQSDGHIDIELLKSVCVSGLDSYHQTNLLQRLPYAKS